MAIPNEKNVSEMSEAYQIGWLDFFWNRFLNFYRCFLGVLWPGGRLESGQNLPGATSSALHSRMSLTWTFIPIKKWPPIFFQCRIFLASCIQCVHQANWCCNFETGSLISEHFGFSELGWHQAYHEARPWPSGAAEGQVLCASAHTDLACAEINYAQSWAVRYSLGRWYYINIMNTQPWTSISTTSR